MPQTNGNSNHSRYHLYSTQYVMRGDNEKNIRPVSTKKSEV